MSESAPARPEPLLNVPNLLSFARIPLAVALFGSEGTLVYDLKRDHLRGAGRLEPDLKPIPIPEPLRGEWRAEADFIAAIRGEGPVTRTTFADGVVSV